MVTGTPGVGKTQLSRLLARRIGATHVDIGKIALREGLIVGTDARRGSRIADLRRLSNWVRKHLNEIKGDIILEGHYASAVIPRQMVWRVVLLRCEPSELIKRLQKKRFSRKKVYENVAAEVLDVCLVEAIRSFRRNKICEIDTTGKTLRSILVETLKLLEGRILPRVGKVDWIARLEERGELDRLLNLERLTRSEWT